LTQKIEGKAVRRSIYFIIFAIVFIFSSQISAQNIENPEAVRMRREQAARNKRFDNIQNTVFSTKTTPDNHPKIINGDRKAFPFKQRLTREQKSHLLPEPADAARYASFLAQPKTGLFKLFPDVGCEKNAHLLRADKECLNWIPNSAFYSFRESEHTTEYLADIRLEKGFLISDGVLSQGILVALGNVPFENITLDSAGMNFLVNYQPEQKNKDAYTQFEQITKGVKSGDFLYKNTLPVNVDTVYGLRIIAYRGRFWQIFRGYRFNVLEGDERTDLMLVFRVVGKSEDGSISLIWKELQRKDALKLTYEKHNK
jgi:hypothetical protein